MIALLDPLPQLGQAPQLVEVLGAFFLALDNHTAGDVPDADSGFRLVGMLASWSGRAEHLDIAFVQKIVV